MASLIDIALEGSDNPILATAARAKRLGRIQEEQGRDLVSPLLTRAAGTPESLLSIVSALGSAVPAGLAGAGRLATGGSVDEAVETIQRVQEPLVFRPRTEAGKATLAQDVGILSALAEPSLFIGGQALEETGSPAAATAAELLLDPLNFLGPIGKGAIVAGAIKSGVKPDVSSFLRPDDPDVTNQALLEAIGRVEPGQRGVEEIAELVNNEASQRLRASLLTDPSPENVERVARVMATNTVRAVQKAEGPDNALWYGRNIMEMHELAAIKFPSLLKSRQEMSAMNYITAVTSNGASVPDNMRTAFKGFEEFKRTGKMPENIGFGERRSAMNEHMRLWNESVERFGMDEWIRILNTDWTPAQLKALGFQTTAKPGRDGTVPGSAILGPKIGGAFFQNLEGNFTPLTLDLWMRRDLGAATGAVVKSNPERMVSSMNRFIAALSDPKGRKVLENALGEPLTQPPNSPEALSELASMIFKRWGRLRGPAGESFPKLLEETGRVSAEGMELVRSARELAKETKVPKGAFTAGERQLSENALRQAVDMLQQEGLAIMPADIQAILWGETQDLWRALGLRIPETTNFAAEAANVLRREGISERKIKNAFGRAAERERLIPERFDLKQKRDFATDVIASAVRDAVSGRLGADEPGVVQRASGRAARYPVGAGAVRFSPSEIEGRFQLPTKLANKFKSFDLGAPPVQQLAESDKANIAFQQRAANAQRSQGAKGLSLTVFDDPAEYTGMKKFLTDDGTAGFAITPDGDIVSVFNTKGGPHKGVTAAMVNMAVDLGGRKLDAFDIRAPGRGAGSGLPRLYARAGMVPVARLKFDPKEAPPGWDEAELGRPDVVFMVVDPSANGKFDLEKTPFVDSFDEAVARQERALKRQGLRE